MSVLGEMKRDFKNSRFNFLKDGTHGKTGIAEKMTYFCYHRLGRQKRFAQRGKNLHRPIVIPVIAPKQRNQRTGINERFSHIFLQWPPGKFPYVGAQRLAGRL